MQKNPEKSINLLKKKVPRDFPGGPVANTPNAGGLGLIPGQGTRGHML